MHWSPMSHPPKSVVLVFGMRQSMDTVGAILGPILAIVLMLWLGQIHLVLWFAVIPAVISVALIVGGVKRTDRCRWRTHLSLTYPLEGPAGFFFPWLLVGGDRRRALHAGPLQ